jgi:FkbM family methyltransferase
LNDWTGINIEPDPYLFDALQLSRIKDINLNCAISDESGVGILYSTGKGIYKGLSTLDNVNANYLNSINIDTEHIEVKLKTLNSIIEENNFDDKEIHFLKIDVEGHEFKVLKSIDLQKYRPIVLVVEATMPMTTIKNHMIFEDYIINNNYTFCLFDGLNRFYVANERSDLFEIASYPVCIFDHPFVQKYH